MRVINERISEQNLDRLKTAYANANNEKQKMEVISELLDSTIKSKDVVDQLLSFGYGYLDNLINAMKWDEFAREDDNPLINFLGSTVDNSNKEYLKSRENFTKLYNVYANNLLDPDYFHEKGGDNLYVKLLTDKRIYSLDEDEIINMFNIFIDLKDSGASETNLKYIFLETPDDAEYSQINSLATIKQRLRSYNKQQEQRKNGKQVNPREITRQKNNQITQDNVDDFINSHSEEEISILKDAIANFENQ